MLTKTERNKKAQNRSDKTMNNKFRMMSGKQSKARTERKQPKVVF